MELSREEADSAICKAAVVTMSHVEEKESRFFFFFGCLFLWSDGIYEVVRIGYSYYSCRDFS